MTCNSCTWFVEEAVKLGKGFCLIKDLFTHAEADDKACADFNEDKNENQE